MILPVTKVDIPTKLAFPYRYSSFDVVNVVKSTGVKLIDNGAFSRVSSSPEEDQLLRSVRNDFHGMLRAMLTAFSEHYPLVLRPQHIWIMILQAISDHVNLNASALQDKWMEGGSKDANGNIVKKVLMVKRDDFVLGNLPEKGNGPRDSCNNWADVVCNPSDGSDDENTFLGQIKMNIRPEAYADLLIDRGLSDTTPIERVSMGITVMTGLQKYFNYMVRTQCGFPYIALEGEHLDWVKVRQTAERLVNERCTNEFASDWLPALLPLLDKFVEQYEIGMEVTCADSSLSTAAANVLLDNSDSKVDATFWNAMVREDGTRGSGGWTWLNGWINILFPYIKKGTVTNTWAFQPYSPLIDYTDRRYKGPNMAHFSSGRSNVPVIWDYSGKPINLEFTSGFLCAKQDEETKEICAEVMWYIAEKR